MANNTQLPQGRKSHVTLCDDGVLIQKTYNHNGDPERKYLREVGFYKHYADSSLIPDMVEARQDERVIVLTRAPGIRCSDLLPDPNLRLQISTDYAEKVVDLISIGNDVHSLKQCFYDGFGASAYRDRVVDILDAYPTGTQQAEQIIRRLRVSATQINITDEILIKLDWNASNVFIDNGRVTQFIDFEQSFIGTREILTGILLHNPFWSAPSLFTILRRRGIFSRSNEDVIPFVDFALAAVIADAFERNGHSWNEQRLVTAFQQHVLQRINELSSSW